MGTEVVGDHDLAFPEGRDKAVATYPAKRAVVIAPSNRISGPTPSRVRAATTVLFSPQLAGPSRERADHAAPRRGSGCRPGGSGLIQEDQILGAERRHVLAPGGPLRLVPFPCPQRLFFRVHPSRVSARLIVAVLTSTPDCSCHQEHCSSNVASARSARRAGSASMTAFIFTAGGPAPASAPTRPSPASAAATARYSTPTPQTSPPRRHVASRSPPPAPPVPADPLSTASCSKLDGTINLGASRCTTLSTLTTQTLPTADDVGTSGEPALSTGVLMTLAMAHGYPRLPLKRGVSVAEGERAWRTFTRGADSISLGWQPTPRERPGETIR